jgi:hypothetical protein
VEVVLVITLALTEAAELLTKAELVETDLPEEVL